MQGLLCIRKARIVMWRRLWIQLKKIREAHRCSTRSPRRSAAEGWDTKVRHQGGLEMSESVTDVEFYNGSDDESN